MSSSDRLLHRLQAVAPTVSVGMLSADLYSLAADLALLEKAGVRLLHFDVMDGCFCPMLTMGPAFIGAIETEMIKDVHLAIVDPLEKIEPFVAAGADMITIHVEASRHPHRVLQALGQMQNANDPGHGLVRGVALNPGTPIESIEPLLDEVDVVFLLAVNPGWRGQAFLSTTAARVRQLRELVARTQRSVLVGIDGGVTRANIEEVARLRPDIVVSGSAVLDGAAVEQNARFMIETLQREQPRGKDELLQETPSNDDEERPGENPALPTS